MSSKLNPYIGFAGNAREAIEFYKTALGGTVTLTSYKDGGMPHDPSESEKIMHAQLDTPNGMILMFSDAPNGMPLDSGSSVSLSLSGDDVEELKGYWNKLSEGATVDQPLMEAPWGDTFGMLTDKFGTKWMVNISGKKE